MGNINKVHCSCRETIPQPGDEVFVADKESTELRRREQKWYYIGKNKEGRFVAEHGGEILAWNFCVKARELPKLTKRELVEKIGYDFELVENK